MAYSDVETSSVSYAQRFAGAAGTWLLARQTSLLEALLRETAPCSVLDVGGGHAQAVEPVLELGCALTVLGSDPVCAERLESWIDRKAITFACGDLLSLPYPDDAFDVVLSLRLVPHCEEWPQLIAELCRVARRAVILDYPCWESLNLMAAPFFERKRQMEGNTRTWITFRHQQIGAVFKAAGWTRLTRKKQFFWPMVLHRKLDRPMLSQTVEAAAAGLGLRYLFGSPVLIRAEK
jgi:ubiquinone/menaquinone biosynthesis C-methylase UbiE